MVMFCPKAKATVIITLIRPPHHIDPNHYRQAFAQISRFELGGLPGGRDQHQELFSVGLALQDRRLRSGRYGDVVQVDVGGAVAVADVVRVVHLDQEVASLGGYLEQAILQVALFGRAPSEVVPEVRHFHPGCNICVCPSDLHVSNWVLVH